MSKIDKIIESVIKTHKRKKINESIMDKVIPLGGANGYTICSYNFDGVTKYNVVKNGEFMYDEWFDSVKKTSSFEFDLIKNGETTKLNCKGQKLQESWINDTLHYTHFAVNKNDDKIYNAWDYNGVDNESIKYYSTIDLQDNDLNPKDFKILTRKSMTLRNIDPNNEDNWWNL